jgi:hypothetical protein
MKKRFTILMLTLILISIAGLVFGAEMSKEGSVSSATYFTSTFQILAHEKVNVVVNYDARGVSGTDIETSPFYNASTQCVGSFKGVKGEFKEMGLCTYTRPDGDKIYISYEAAGKMGTPVKGHSTIVGGTGKCAGITGGGDFTRVTLKGPAEGIGASISKINTSWKIP